LAPLDPHPLASPTVPSPRPRSQLAIPLKTTTLTDLVPPFTAFIRREYSPVSPWGLPGRFAPLGKTAGWVVWAGPWSLFIRAHSHHPPVATAAVPPPLPPCAIPRLVCVGQGEADKSVASIRAFQELRRQAASLQICNDAAVGIMGKYVRCMGCGHPPAPPPPPGLARPHAHTHTSPHPLCFAVVAPGDAHRAWCVGPSPATQLHFSAGACRGEVPRVGVPGEEGEGEQGAVKP
jgi:hypothetical protein